MTNTQPGPGWWQASDGNWYAPELHPDRRPPDPDYRSPDYESWVDGLAAPPGEAVVDPRDLSDTPDRRRRPDSPLNELHAVAYRGGWIGMLAGENQVRALQRAIVEINASGFRVVAAVDDRWSVWQRIWAVMLFIVTLGFVGRVQNVLLITERVD
jgi:hypothetical protein